MTASALQYEPEPFGQRGVRPLVRPIVVGFCAIAVAVSAAMWYRSQHNYDSLYRVADDRAIEVASVLGRFMITTRATNRPAPQQGEVWTYESQEFGTMYDAWRPSIWKTIGVDWGEEDILTYGGRRSYWRFRLAWRTAAICAMTPLLIDATLRRRRSHRTPADVNGA